MDGMSHYLADHQFVELFRDELGWDRSSGTLSIDVEERHFDFDAIAQKRGFQVLRCIADRRVLLNQGLLREIQKKLSLSVHEHILIYECKKPLKQVWQWAIRTPQGPRMRHREHPFFSASPPESLIKRLRGLRFSFDEEEVVTFVDALHRVRMALDVSSELNLFAKRPKYANRSDELAVAMARGDKEAFTSFILLHRPLARHISKRIQRHYGVEADDAEQIGTIGLIIAARRFDPERGIQFSTYATHWIRQACQRYGPDAALFIRLPTNIVRTFFPLRIHIEKLAAEQGPGAANDEMLRMCDEDSLFFRQWLSFTRALNVRSLSDRGEPEYFEARTLQAAGDDEPLQIVMYKERFERIRAAMDSLNERQRRFLRLRYGMECQPRTLEEIGQPEGITKERVRQILMATEKKLRFFVEHEMEDLIPVRTAAIQEKQTLTEDEFPLAGVIA